MKIPKSLFFLLFIFSGTAAVFFFFFNPKSVPSFSRRNIIVLDAGHGAPDGGAVGYNGTLEKDVNLAIVLKIREILEARGFHVILTRTSDNGIYDSDAKSIHEMKVSDMKKRRDIINNSNADLFISVHMNSFSNPSSNGLHVFYARNHPESEPLAQSIQSEIAALTGASVHTVKTASESLYLMKNPIPPSILVECGFISNPEEEERLNDDSYRSKIAYAIANAVTKAP